jgi:hypothetical protein
MWQNFPNIWNWERDCFKGIYLRAIADSFLNEESKDEVAKLGEAAVCIFGDLPEEGLESVPIQNVCNQGDVKYNLCSS